MVEVASLPYREGVGMVLFNRAGNVFVAKRIDSIAEAWQMPQGGIDDGENPETAMYRELMEETGLAESDVSLLAASSSQLSYDLPENLVPILWKGRYRGQRQWWYALRLLSDDSAINIETEMPEFSEWKWVDLHQLPELIVPFKRTMYADLVQEFNRFQRTN